MELQTTKANIATRFGYLDLAFGSEKFVVAIILLKK